jgi:CHAT domain-containing protein
MKYAIIFFFWAISFQLAIGQNIDSLVAATVDQAEILRKEFFKYDEAIFLLKQTLENCIGKEGLTEIQIAPLYHKIGVNYYFKGDMNKALEFNSIALSIREKKLGSNHIDVIRGYFNRASILRKNQDFSKAKEDLGKAILGMELLIDSKKSVDTVRLINMYSEMYKLNSYIRDNKTAINFLQLVYDYLSKDSLKYKEKIADLYLSKGVIFFDQKEYFLAKKNYLKSKEIYSTLKNKKIENVTPLHNLANCEQAMGNFQSAKRYYSQTIELYEYFLKRQNSLEVSQRLGNTYTDLVNLCAQTREWNEGKQYYDLALKYTTEGWGTFFHPRLAELYRNRTRLSLGQGHFEESLVFNQKSLQALLPDLKTDDPFVSVNLNEHGIKNKNSLLETLNQKAEIFMAKYEKGSGADLKYLDAAFRNFKTLDTLITQIRQSYEAQGSQFELIEQTYPIYEKAITTALELFEKKQDFRYLESAYHFAAKNKAMVLLAGMQEEEAKVYSSIPEALKSTEKNLKRSIFQLESKIYQQAGATSDPGLRDSLFVLKRNYQKLIDRFELEHPDYYDLKYRFDKTISVEKLQSQMLQGHSVIEYFVGDDAIFIFTITKNNFNYESFSKPEEFDQILERFRNSMENPRNAENLFADSYQIYEWLVKPSLEKVAGETAIEHLTFIPDGPLLQLSFDVLITAPFEQIPYYLLQKYPISYAYSNRLLFDDISRESAPNTFAGFGLEYDDYTLTDLATYVNNPMSSLPLSRALGPLLFSDDEVKEISELLDGHTWINEAATREAFLENAGDYAILHLATHGVLNERYPMNSALIFTRQNDSTDYFLRAADLYGMELKAEMTVLSACNTGNGIVERGEGVRSLARAFAAAGCPSLVASLWNASDASTKKILVSFYENLEKGQTKAEAMRQAKLAYLKKAPPTYRAPYYWSHLSVIGESGELDVLNKPWWRKYWYLWAAGMGIAGALVASRWKAAA